MVASSRLAGMRSPGRKSPACTRARNWSRSWMYSGTWLCGWRWSGSIVSHLRPILPDIGLPQEPICLPAGATPGRPLPRSAKATHRPRFRGTWFTDSLAWFVPDSAVDFPRFQVADAQSRQILLIALIYLLHGKIRVIKLILPCRHAFRIIRRGSDHRTSLSNAHAEFPRGWLIICVAEATSDASTLDRMADK